MSGAEIGRSAPQFVTRNQHGETISLEGLRGAPVVLMFYPFAFTGICTSELASVQEQLPAFDEHRARVLAVSTDSMFALRVFAEQEHLGFDLLTDHWPHGEIAAAYGVFDAAVGCAIRGSFVMDADGVVTWKVVNQLGEARDIAGHVSALAA